jgi:hypothetical protein
LAASALWAIFLPIVMWIPSFSVVSDRDCGPTVSTAVSAPTGAHRSARSALLSVNGRSGLALEHLDEPDNYGDEADDESNVDDHVDASDLVLELQYTPHLQGCQRC